MRFGARVASQRQCLWLKPTRGRCRIRLAANRGENPDILKSGFGVPRELETIAAWRVGHDDGLYAAPRKRSQLKITAR